MTGVQTCALPDLKEFLGLMVNNGGGMGLRKDRFSTYSAAFGRAAAGDEQPESFGKHGDVQVDRTCVRQT